MPDHTFLRGVFFDTTIRTILVTQAQTYSLTVISCRKIFSMLMQMNVPLYEDGTVEFHSTFMALVRYRLQIYRGTLATSIDSTTSSWAYQNEALKEAIIQLWPRTDHQLLSKVHFPPSPLQRFLHSFMRTYASTSPI